MKRNKSLDGLRAFAITLIVASHTQILLQGGLGNAIFFCVSGFFAANPFKDANELGFLNVRNIFHYYLSRIIRIIPVYYVVIILTYYITRNFLGGKIGVLKHMLFIDCFGHLWFLQQEMLMYVLVPCIMIFIGLIRMRMNIKYKNLIIAIILAISAFLIDRYLSVDVFCLYANGGRQKFRLGQFIVGMATAYAYKHIIETDRKYEYNGLVRFLTKLFSVAFIVFCIFSSEQILEIISPSYDGFFIGWEKPMMCTFFSALFILSVLVNPDQLLVRLLGSKYISFIGKISFGIYLVHYFVVPYVRFGSSYRNFTVVYIISIGIAILLYYMIEQPSSVFAKKRKLGQVIEYYKNLAI